MAVKPAEILNHRRFLSLDLNYGRRVDSQVYEYLLDNGMSRQEYHFFLEQILPTHTQGLFSQLPIVMPGEVH